MTKDEALMYLKAIVEAFGPDDGIELDQKTWAKLHTAIKEALALPKQDGECKYCTHGCPACDARRQSNVLP